MSDGSERFGTGGSTVGSGRLTCGAERLIESPAVDSVYEVVMVCHRRAGHEGLHVARSGNFMSQWKDDAPTSTKEG